MKKINIFGHKNPDTDSVCGAISLSYLKNKLGYNTVPRVLGEINDETAFALNYFNVSVPKFLNNVKVKIKDVFYHKDFYVRENDSIYNTYFFMNERNITGVPLVNDDRKFVGYVSLKEIAKSMIAESTDYLDTTFNNIVSTLQSINYVRIDDNIKGNIVAAIFDDNTFINNVKLNNDSILIVGDRQKILDYAIESKVKLIILIGNIELMPEHLILAKANNINIICTPFSSFQTSKLLGLSNRIGSIRRGENCVCLDTESYLSDFIDISNKTKHTNYPIVNKFGTCYGLLRLTDINEYEKDKVILVDHNELKQSADGIEEAEILEIVDHHNISDINTNSPINFRNMAVGSVNTIIYYLYTENSVDIPNDIAGLMISGIISDTVLLNSPTTTFYDKFVINQLSRQIGIDYNDYGMKLLRSGMDISNLSIDDIIYRDYKTYNIGDNKFSIGQILSVDFNDFKDKIDLYKLELDQICTKNSYKLVALFVTNIITKSSYVIYSSGSEEILKIAFGLDNVYQGVEIDGILSRKKQIVPNILDALDKN